jgi:phosphoglycolate phosphatase-like HAD superfamily hydrolase
MKEATTPLCAAILDIDGTLLDSNDAHARAWVDVFTEFGYKTTFDQVRPLIGMGGDKLMPTVVGLQDDSDLGKRIGKRRDEIFGERYLPTLKAFPGTRELLERMQAQGLALVIATSADKDEFKKLVKAARIEDLLDGATTASDADRSKPDPDIVKAAVKKSKCDKSRVVMLGDTPYDVQAATAAGVAVVALRSGGWNDEELRGAAAIYDDPADLLANFASSPFGRGA